MIVAAGAAAKTAVAMLAMMAAQGTLLALVAVAVARAGRLRPGWQATVWLVVLAKLALPWGPAMPYSLADLIESLRGHGEPGVITLATGPVVAAEPASLWPAVGWLALAAAWLIGFAIALARSVIAMRAAHRTARRAPAAPDAARALLASLARRMRVRPPALVVSDATGPHVVGAFRPIVVVPAALVDERALLHAALLHELAHVRRRDALGRAIQIWVGAMFFFWPVVRIVSRRLDLAREAACDAAALEAGELSPPAYARLLVQMAALHAPAEPTLAMAHTLDARVDAVLGPPAVRGASAFHRVLLAAWVVVALGGARTAHARSTRFCNFTPQLAEALRLAHPEADLDGDGVLSREEACEFQAELRRHPDAAADMVSTAGDDQLQSFLEEPLCCNCASAEATSAPELSSSGCQEDQGVDR